MSCASQHSWQATKALFSVPQQCAYASSQTHFEHVTAVAALPAKLRVLASTRHQSNFDICDCRRLSRWKLQPSQFYCFMNLAAEHGINGIFLAQWGHAYVAVMYWLVPFQCVNDVNVQASSF